MKKMTDLMMKDKNGWLQSGHYSFWEDKHQHVLEVIRRGVRCNDDYFEDFYAYAIRQFFSIAMALPASQDNHHNHSGGLIEHTLEVVKTALRLRRNYSYTESKNDSSEMQVDVYTYAVFMAALIHDVGKVVTDFDIVHKDKEDETPTKLAPLVASWPVKKMYKWRYNPHRAHKLHQVGGAAMINRIVPPFGLAWIQQYPRLFNKFLYACAGELSKAGSIGEVIKQADEWSVINWKKSNSTTTDKADAGVDLSNKRKPLSELLLTAIRDSIEANALPLNKRGAAVWVKGRYCYCVSKRVTETAAARLKQNGIAGIPTSNISMFNILCDAGIALRDSDNSPTIRYQIEEQDGWKQPLTFLVIPRDKLDPQNTLGLTESTAKVVYINSLDSEVLKQFLQWLETNIRDKSLKINNEKSLVISLKEGFFCKTPDIVQLYNLRTNSEIQAEKLLNLASKHKILSSGVNGATRTIHLNKSQTNLSGIIIKHDIYSNSPFETGLKPSEYVITA